jgi:hypothetical protein
MSPIFGLTAKYGKKLKDRVIIKLSLVDAQSTHPSKRRRQFSESVNPLQRDFRMSAKTQWSWKVLERSIQFQSA